MKINEEKEVYRDLKLEIKSRRANYFLEFYGKYAVVTGNSGTGKTTFYRILQSYNGKGSTSVTCDKPIKVLDVNADESILTKVNNHLIVIDENCALLHYPYIGKLLKESDNYFILICRKCIDWLPISVDNVFKVTSNGKYHEFIPIVPRFNTTSFGIVDLIITEDSRSSFLFFKQYFPEISIKSASSKSKMTDRLLQEYLIEPNRRILVVYDASAFGAQIADLRAFFDKWKPNGISVLDWESFEWYILKSKVFNEVYTLKDVDLRAESLEQFCTKRLNELVSYDKSKLLKCLKLDRNCGRCHNCSECKYKNSKNPRELFIDDTMKTIKSSTRSMNAFGGIN